MAVSIPLCPKAAMKTPVLLLPLVPSQSGLGETSVSLEAEVFLALMAIHVSVQWCFLAAGWEQRWEGPPYYILDLFSVTSLGPLAPYGHWGKVKSGV